jgi:hypothetical protein
LIRTKVWVGFESKVQTLFVLFCEFFLVYFSFSFSQIFDKITSTMAASSGEHHQAVVGCKEY